MVTPVFSTTLDLDPAVAKNGTEIVEVIQSGKSVQIPVKDLVAVDSYSLAYQQTTGACDLSKHQSYSIDISAAGAKTVSFTNAPAGRSMTVVFKVKGNVGSITWPAAVTWSDSLAPEFGANSTIVILFWDGTNFLGARGASN